MVSAARAGEAASRHELTAAAAAIAKMRFILRARMILSFKFSERHHQPFERGVAVHEIDALPGNLDAIYAADQTMEAGAAEAALRLASIFQQLEFRAHD